MTIPEFLQILDARPVKPFNPTGVVKGIFASDMMSEVLNLQDSDVVLLTTLNNPQVIRTAEMLDLLCVCFVSDKSPSDKTIKLAHEKNIPIVLTTLGMFDACGKLYGAGLRGAS